MTPVEYQNQYLALPVQFTENDKTNLTVKIDKYVLRRGADEQRQLWQAVAKYMENKAKDAKKNEGEFKPTVIVNGSAATFNKYQDLLPYVSKPFTGKGSPEHCQIVAQLAVLSGRTTVDQLQKYCNDNIGLDCAGFVGNYLWSQFGKGKGDWRLLASGKEKTPNPEMSVDGFFDHPADTQPRASLDQVQPGEVNILGLVSATTFGIVPNAIFDAKGAVLDSGHIVMTEPGKFDKTAATAKTPASLRLWAVEATADAGLTANWCTITEVINGKKVQKVTGYPHNAVFNIHRDSKNVDNLFAISAVPLVKMS
jgi:hypothetical protein